ncbi:iron-sulfur cluster co-chaperone protein HscB [Rhagoletis pomonella]|uniref:iron-sulfur cluster co-chaperone protein HscB n=1 Tax=Rhagoletis pomonella TaxID=28610 RepID=UPI001783C6C7|nr:iron-sulfur cluster co-chaperone protein HscB [Rhagoletis pomonella]
MRRFARGLHTIRSELNSSGDYASLPTLASFCLVPNSAGEKNELVKSAITRAAGCAAKCMVTQQVRKYAPSTGKTLIENACWNCKRSGRKNHMMCQFCGYLQDVDMDINYFELLNFPNSFSLDQKDLTRRFRQLQTIVHPDKFSNKTSREQNNSADWSALINKAYKTLSTPIERGQYILKLQGEQMPQDNSALDKEFLMVMMERNEEVEEANTGEELQRLNKDIVQELNASAIELSNKFESNALNEAKSLLVKMKYLTSVQKSIKNKIQRLMGG